MMKGHPTQTSFLSYAPVAGPSHTGGRGRGDRDVGGVNFALSSSLELSDQTCIQHVPGLASIWEAGIIDFCVLLMDAIFSKVVLV